jgi:hypothetical protein
MILHRDDEPVSKRSFSVVLIVAYTAMFLVLCQGVLFYWYFRKTSDENSALRSQIADLQIEMKSVSQEGRQAVQDEVESQLATLFGSRRETVSYDNA